MTGAASEQERTPRVRMTGTQRREQLIEVGRTLFAERGYEAASVEEIAGRANVSKPVVYEHFGGKEGLYAVIVDREMSTLLGMITSSLELNRSRIRVERVALALVVLRQALALLGGELSHQVSFGFLGLGFFAMRIAAATL